MDLRARLILSLSPLLVALALIGVIALYSQQRITAFTRSNELPRLLQQLIAAPVIL